MTCAEYIVESLIAQGIKVVYGMPGGHLGHIYDALRERQDAIRHILVRHELGAALMADGHARASNGIGVCLTIPGPGATNAATGLVEARSASSRVLLITSGCDAALLSKDQSTVFHGLDHQSFFKPVAKSAARVDAPEELPSALKEAFAVLWSGMPGPVVLEVPREVLSAPISGPLVEREASSRDAASADALSEIAEALGRAERPVIVAGVGILRENLTAELASLAEVLGAPVTTTAFARGALSDEHPLAIGDLHWSSPQAALGEADVVLAVGAKFNQMDTRNWALKFGERLIRLNSEPASGDGYEDATQIVGDLRSALSSLTDTLRAANQQPRAEWGQKAAELHASYEQRDTGPAIAALRDALSRDGILVTDVHMTGYRMRNEFRVYEPNALLSSDVCITLGFGLPEAIGAKLACPGRPVLACCGDGGFMLTCQELATAAQFDVRLVIVIFNDNRLTSIKSVQDAHFGGKTFAIDLKNPDFVKLAEAFGVRGVRVGSLPALTREVQRGFEADELLVVEYPLGHE